MPQRSDTVYLIRFGVLGYYAAKQPVLEWSFTNDPLEARQFPTEESAAFWGSQGVNNGVMLYEVEKFEVHTSMKNVTRLYDL